MRFARLWRWARATRFRRWSLRLLIAGTLCWTAVWYVLPWTVSLPDGLQEPPPAGVEIVDRNGVPLRKLLNKEGHRKEVSTDLSAIPDDLIKATLAAEDKRFWTHGGVDLLALMRAISDGIEAGRPVSGASTITQQLIKISAPERRRTVRAKLREFLAARKLEMLWRKDKILAAYFDRLDYGNLRIGASAAALGYFGKPLSDCSLAECSLLAGLPQAPSRMNPYKHLKRSKSRQEWILSRMVEDRSISASEAEDAAREELLLVRNFGAFKAPHFVDQVVASLNTDEAFDQATVRTTLDGDLQQFCESTIATHLDRLLAYNVTNASIVVLDNDGGDVLAMVGSANYEARNGGQNNGALSARSPGSALKPFTYLIALERGDTPASIADDVTVEFMTTTGIYRPENYDHRSHGPVSYRRALGNSLNISAVRVLDRIGGAKILMNALGACGISTLTEPAEHYGLALTIGSAEVNLLELTNAYSCLARMGIARPWQIREEAVTLEGKRVFDADACYLIADMLSDPAARAAAFGPDSLLNLPFPVACKTGTSSDYRDNWTIGFTPEVTVGVWAGNFDGEPMQNVSGISGAGPIFRDVLMHLNKKRNLTWFAQPDSIVECTIDPATGLPLAPGVAVPRPLVTEKFRAWNVPKADLDRYDSLGRVRLPPIYGNWLESRENWLGETAFVENGTTESLPALRIVSPLPGTVVYLDPDLPYRGSRLPVIASGTSAGSDVVWSSATLRVAQLPTGPHAILREGRHQLMVRDPGTGLTRETWLEVRAL